ncbi:sugar transferase [Cohnella xylanilytica]|uniref:sugar transferase n=1 Tax=Cohnella xylanilytica TaxID=557555 RepID=UPI002795AB3B|nr:sugar transferase [Cohnella xylanilytica]
MYRYVAIKRILDIVIAFCGLVILLPFLLLIAILIKCEDPKGSVIFSQIRVGKDGKLFRMYKFRSMVTNAEKLLDKLLDQNEVEGAMFKMKLDPRVTKVGRFIRKTSIDELPQLWNVIMGNMSLVGPRPPLPREVEEYTEYQRLRLSVVPGCTGLWQVSGRSNLGFSEMVELDIQYIERRGLKTDLIILMKTIKVVLGSKDAF